MSRSERKGQYAIIEHVILIGLGITIVLGFMATFAIMGNDLRGTASERQTKLFSQYMASNAVELVESGARGKFIVELPSSVAQQDYAMQFVGNGIRTTTAGAASQASMYGLQNKIDFTGSMVSRDPVISLTYDGETVVMAREQ